jgi:hypothetical protein
MITSQEEVELLWKHAFEMLKVDDLSDYNVLITEPPHAPEERRRWKV